MLLAWAVEMKNLRHTEVGDNSVSGVLPLHIGDLSLIPRTHINNNNNNERQV